LTGLHDSWNYCLDLSSIFTVIFDLGTIEFGFGNKTRDMLLIVSPLMTVSKWWKTDYAILKQEKIKL